MMILMMMPVTMPPVAGSHKKTKTMPNRCYILLNSVIDLTNKNIMVLKSYYIFMSL